MKESDCPIALLDYCVEKRAHINNLTVKDSFKLNGTTPHTVLSEREGDISKILGHILGPAKGEGNEMAQWVMKGNGNVVPCQTLRLLKVDKLNSKTEIRSRNLFYSLITRRWGMSMNPPSERTPNDWDPCDEYEDDDEIARSLPETEETVDSNCTLIDQQPAYNEIISTEVQRHHQDHITTGKVKSRAIGTNCRTSGSYNDNPMLNSTVYKVETPDKEVKGYANNCGYLKYADTGGL
eukprot:9504079-Ditylum_brightwellii.AAC.1